MPKIDIYEDVTNDIISLLDKVDIQDYEPPFAGLCAQGLPTNPTTGNAYRGINILSLWFNQQAKGFGSNEWASYKQWQSIGAQVRKEEKSTRVVFYKTLERTVTTGDGEEENAKIPMLRTYNVFNALQVDGYDIHQNYKGAPAFEEHFDLLDEFCANTRADIRHDAQRAYYDIMQDSIHLPKPYEFVPTKHAHASDNYYSTILHELAHWTGAKQRLGRFNSSNSDKSEYAFEELIAELSAAFLCAQLNLKQGSREDHAIYLKSWLTALKSDKKHIFKAAAQASKACEYLNQLQTEPCS